MRRCPAAAATAAALGVESRAKHLSVSPCSRQLGWLPHQLWSMALVHGPGAHTPALVLSVGCVLAWVVPSSSLYFLCELGRWEGGIHSSPPMTQSTISLIHGILLCPCFILPHPWIKQKYDSHWADEDIKVRKGDRILLRSCSQMGTPGGGMSPIPHA